MKILWHRKCQNGSIVKFSLFLYLSTVNSMLALYFWGEGPLNAWALRWFSVPPSVWDDAVLWSNVDSYCATSICPTMPTTIKLCSLHVHATIRKSCYFFRCYALVNTILCMPFHWYRIIEARNRNKILWLHIFHLATASASGDCIIFYWMFLLVLLLLFLSFLLHIRSCVVFNNIFIMALWVDNR